MIEEAKRKQAVNTRQAMVNAEQAANSGASNTPAAAAQEASPKSTAKKSKKNVDQ